jgi:SAM-dependent methyltransferase
MTQPTAFDENYFSSNTYEKVSFAKYSMYWWSNRFYAILARRYGKKGSRLLEIGSGMGHLIGSLEADFETVALDVNHWALMQSKSVAPLTDLNAGSAESLPFADASFGVVIIKHVVEHLRDPERAISELGRILSSGGILLLATPNLNSLLKPLKGDAWIGYQDPTHIALKPPAEWLNFLRSAGFNPPLKLFSDGFWDVPYIPLLPAGLQKLLFGSLGGLQAILGIPFLPLRWGESMMLIAEKA